MPRSVASTRRPDRNRQRGRKSRQPGPIGHLRPFASPAPSHKAPNRKCARRDCWMSEGNVSATNATATPIGSHGESASSIDAPTTADESCVAIRACRRRHRDRPQPLHQIPHPRRPGPPGSPEARKNLESCDADPIARGEADCGRSAALHRDAYLSVTRCTFANPVCNSVADQTSRPRSLTMEAGPMRKPM